LRPADDLAVEDGVPGIGVRGPATPSLGDLAEIVLGREAFADRLTRDRGTGDAVGPQPSPPGAVVWRCEAPHGRARPYVVETSGVRPCEEESARVRLACVAARDRAVEREPAADRGLVGVPAEAAIVTVARGDQPARLADSLHLAQRTNGVGEM